MPNAKSSDDINNALERIRWLGRESISLHNYVGAEYSKLQQPGLAIEQFESSIEVFPTPDAYAALGNEYRRTGVPQKARDAYSKALAIDADAAMALLGYSASLAIDEPHPTEADRSKASQMLKRVLEIYPGQSDATQMLRQLRRHDAKP
jgi:tetratricopeptide (TPR) repeat protein